MDFGRKEKNVECRMQNLKYERLGKTTGASLEIKKYISGCPNVYSRVQYLQYKDKKSAANSLSSALSPPSVRTK